MELVKLVAISKHELTGKCTLLGPNLSRQAIMHV